MMEYIKPICFFISLILVSIFLHELGHIFAIKKLGKKVKVKFKNLVISINTPAHNMDLSDRQYKEVLLTGVIFGLLPSLFVFLNFSLLVSCLFIGGYLFGGSWHDIQQLIKLSRKPKY